MTLNSNERAERKIMDTDVSEGDVLHDNVYDEQCEVVGRYVGAVYLRYPHHDYDPSAPEDSHIQSVSYQWPLDGHRFEVVR